MRSRRRNPVTPSRAASSMNEHLREVCERPYDHLSEVGEWQSDHLREVCEAQSDHLREVGEWQSSPEAAMSQRGHGHDEAADTHEESKQTTICTVRCRRRRMNCLVAKGIVVGVNVIGVGGRRSSFQALA